jgi:4-hydroxybenzoate polyprenyltransferase
MTIRSVFYTGLIFIPLSAASMALFFSVLFYNILSLPYFLLVFSLTYAVYGMDRLAGMEEDRISHPERTTFLERNRRPFIGTVVLAFSGALLLAARSRWVLVLIPLAPLAVMLYSGNLASKMLGTRKPNLKQYFLIKDCVIAAGWAFLLLVTSLYHNLSMTAEQWLFLIPLLMKLFVMASAYDFKDISSDRRTSVRTLPVVIGERSSKLVLHVLNTVATALILLLVYFGYLPLLGLVFLPALLYQFVMIHLVRENAPAWVYFILCDLEQFFWLVFLGIGGGMIGYF